MLLTDADIQAIRQLIATYHSAFIVNTIDPKVVSAEVLEQLKAKGLVNVEVNTMEDAYTYGQILAASNDPRTANMTMQQFRDHLRNNPIPVTLSEQQAIKMNQQQAAQYVRGLGNKVDTKTGATLIEEDHALRRQMRDKITEAVSRNIAARQTVKQLKSDLGWATEDWTRDLDRIAITEKQSAVEQGKAETYAKEHGSGTRVAKLVAPDCCKHCERLYVGPDGAPRIFLLRDLEANGTNVGRKVGDWRPCVGPVHPHCCCTLIRIPMGMGFNADNELVADGKFGVQYDPETLEASMRHEATLRKALTYAGQTTMAFQGVPIVIEHPEGSIRSSTDRNGKTWHQPMLFAYGYIDGTHGFDGEEVDCYIGPVALARRAYIIHQTDDKGVFDEAKVMLGFSSEQDARDAYAAGRPDGDARIGHVDPLPIGMLKRWLAAQAHMAVLKSEYVGNQLAGRNVRGSGMDGANFYFNTPVIRPPAPGLAQAAGVTGYDEFFEERPYDERNVIIRDKEVYDVEQAVPRRKHRFTMNPQLLGIVRTDRTEDAAVNRALIDIEVDRRALIANTLQPSKPSNRDVPPSMVLRRDRIEATKGAKRKAFKKDARDA